MDFEKIVVTEELNIREALQLLDSTEKKVLFVVNNNKLTGAVSDGDVRRWILKNGGLNDSVKSVMNRNPIFLTEDNKAKALKIMNAEGILAVPIVNDNKKIETIYFWADDKPVNRTALGLKVIIMAGGKGERLRPYTNIVPKPLIPVGDMPIVEHIIERFRKYGCNDFVLSINYKKNMIKAYFDEIEKDYQLSYIEEVNPLGTGGSLYYLKGDVKDTFFISNCDILLDVDYEDVYRKHKNDQNKITIITSLNQYTIPYGVINTNHNGEVDSISEKPSLNYLINTGVYVFEPDVLKYICEDKFMHITELIDSCILKGIKVGTYPISENSWMDMGQFNDLEKMKNRLQEEIDG